LQQVLTDLSYLDDIYHVGPRKPLGYLPIDTLTRLCGQDLLATFARCQAQGNQSRWFSERECQVGSGALYVWHPPSLNLLLKEELATLRKFRVPVTPNAFVQAVAQLHFNAPKMQRIVGLAFADPRWTR
jgi:hypothetical protein